MECYSEQTCTIFVDGELAGDEARRLREHLEACPRCRKLVDALRAENLVLEESLQELPAEPAGLAEFPRVRLSWLWGDLAVLAVVLAVGSIFSASIGKVNIPDAVEWFNPFTVGGFTNLILDLSYYFAHGGAAMLANYAAVIGGLLLLLGGALLLARRSRSQQPGLQLLIIVLALCLPGFSLERRHGEFVTVAANETIDDTLVAAGNTVQVDGVVNGDLLAFGRTLEVRGSVKGDLVSFAKRTLVSGTVEGRIYNCSQSFNLEGQLSHSLYSWSQSLRIDRRAQVGEGVVAGGDNISLDGEVKRSASLFASDVDVNGTIGRDLTMAGGNLTLSNAARVGGDLSARVRDLKNVHIAEAAVIAGKRDIQVRVRHSQFARPKFYFFQAIWLAAAMLIGWLGFLLFPNFFQACSQAVASGWRSLGLGVAVLAGVPVAIIVAAITLVGIPISLMLFALYAIAIYLAKIWVGAFLGRMILKPAAATKSDWLLTLLLGLFIITIVGFVPYLGGFVRFAVVCIGLGAFAWQLHRALVSPATV